MSFKSFDDYLEAKKSMAVEKPPVEEVPDYHGEKNPYAKTTPPREVKDAKGEDKIAVKKPKVEEVPDFHGKPNPGVKKEKGKKKNIKGDQVVEVARFKDYLEAKLLDQKPKVAINVTDFPQQNAPPSSPGQCCAPAPYKATDKPKVSNKPLGDQGSTPAYIPKVCPKKDTKELEPLKKVKGGQPQAESKLENMSLLEVTRYVSEQNRLLSEHEGTDDSIPTVTAWTSGKIMPDPLETVEYISHLASQNANLMEMLVRTLKKKQGGMGGLVGKLLDQPETFKELVGHFEGEHGPKHAGSMCRAMSDAYNDFMSEHSSVNESALSPPIGFKDADTEEDPEYQETPDEEAPEDSDSPDDLDDQGFDDEEEDHVDEPPSELPKKKKKAFSHDNLIGAMSEHKHMLDAMTAHCKKCGNL